jgi:predicted extracellular nuclease
MKIALRVLGCLALLALATAGCARSEPTDGDCGAPATRLHTIQGTGARSPLEDTRQVVEAVVVADYQGQSGLGGFFLQEEDGDADSDPATSEGIFVWTRDAAIPVELGDVVRLSGVVKEYAAGEHPAASLTELVDPDAARICARGVDVAATRVSLAEAPAWEPLEGMRVSLSGVVTDTWEWRRFGVLGLAPARLLAATEVESPGPDAAARHARDERSRVRLDDGSAKRGPRHAPPAPRAGDALPHVDAVVDQRFGAHRLQPRGTLEREVRNPRAGAPSRAGRVRVVAFNVHNFFHTLDDGERRCGPGRNLACRGAETEAERAVQLARLAAALRALAPDVAALSEVENGAPEALRALAGAIGEDAVAIETGPIGSDAIRVALIYRSGRIAARGAFAVLDARSHPDYDDRRNRPSLAQTFELRETGERFTVATTHLKSKSRPCPGDPDRGDGQGDCNATRTRAAGILADWLVSDPTGLGGGQALLVGDLNAYRREDPIRALSAAGLVDLLDRDAAAQHYTFAFDGRFGALDHAFATRVLAPAVRQATTWAINADEPLPADGDLGPFGSSDHDPVVVDLF